MPYEKYIRGIVGSTKHGERIKSRERNDLEFKESFGLNSWAKYAKTMASYANNRGGYILFGIKDNPREITGVNASFQDFKQEKFTESLNALFSPEILWETGIVDFDGFSIGYIYTHESLSKPVMALKNESSEKINSGDVFYRYRARSEKIKFPEMRQIIEERAKKERDQILKLMETIRKSDTTNLGVVNYDNGRFTTPNGVDVTVDKRLILQVLKKAKFIKEGSFDENGGTPVLKVTGEIALAEEIPVPDIDPDIQYPYLQKNLAEKLGIERKYLYALIWHYKMKGTKKYHMKISTSSASEIHKFSDIALQFLADEINKNRMNPNWLASIYEKFVARNRQ